VRRHLLLHEFPELRPEHLLVIGKCAAHMCFP
jgi:hypothetical protein